MAAPAARPRAGGSAGGAKRAGQRKASAWKGAVQRRKDLKASIEQSKLERRRAKALKELGGAQNYTEQALRMEEHVSERRKRYGQLQSEEGDTERSDGGGAAVQEGLNALEPLEGQPAIADPEKPHDVREAREPRRGRKRHSALQDALDAAAERKKAFEEREKAYQEGIARRDQKRRERKQYNRQRFKFTSRGQPFMSTFVADALKRLDAASGAGNAGK